jgi:hypothetical protein
VKAKFHGLRSFMDYFSGDKTKPAAPFHGNN